MTASANIAETPTRSDVSVTPGTDDRDGVRSVPDASRFGRRVERRPWRGRSAWTTVPEWRALTGDELDALPVGTRRTVAFVPGVYVGLVKTHEGWTLLARYRIPNDVLAGLRSAPRVPIDPEEPATADAGT